MTVKSIIRSVCTNLLGGLARVENRAAVVHGDGRGPVDVPVRVEHPAERRLEDAAVEAHVQLCIGVGIVLRV